MIFKCILIDSLHGFTFLSLPNTLIGKYSQKLKQISKPERSLCNLNFQTKSLGSGSPVDLSRSPSTPVKKIAIPRALRRNESKRQEASWIELNNFSQHASWWFPCFSSVSPSALPKSCWQVTTASAPAYRHAPRAINERMYIPRGFPGTHEGHLASNWEDLEMRPCWGKCKDCAVPSCEPSALWPCQQACRLHCRFHLLSPGTVSPR